MNPDDWRALGEVAGLTGLGLYTAWKARKAEKYAKPTGNGFAASVKESLRRIEHKVERTEEKVDRHIEAHAEAHVAKLKPRRVLRDVNEL
jgi:hypothetical protein